MKVTSWKLSHRRLQFSRRLLCDSDQALFILAEQLLPSGSRYTVPPSRQLYKQRKTQQWLPTVLLAAPSQTAGRIVPLCTLVVWCRRDKRVNTCMSPALLTATGRCACVCPWPNVACNGIPPRSIMPINTNATKYLAFYGSDD